MKPRSLSFADRLIGEIDKAIKVLACPPHAAREFPSGAPTAPASAAASSPGVAAPDAAPALSESERHQAVRLMRVNHAGEVAAQALYQGQALTARNAAVATAMRRAATEEIDHLSWCQQRLDELQGRTSLLNPLWYAGSFAIGAVAGALGDRTSLSFIAETEKQVESHLSDHLDRLPIADRRTRRNRTRCAGHLARCAHIAISPPHGDAPDFASDDARILLALENRLMLAIPGLM
jgi:ubiquinone biosynthesis monooxygenase Coq7